MVGVDQSPRDGSSRRIRLLRRPLFWFWTIAVVSMALWLWVNVRWSAHVAACNASGSELSAVRIILHDRDDGRAIAEASWDRLKPGEAGAVFDPTNDCRVELRYTINQVSHLEWQYVPVWNREAFSFEVQPDGALGGGYYRGLPNLPFRVITN